MGSKVQFAANKKNFEKSYLQNWTSEIFYVHAIDRQQSPIMYVIKDYHDKILEGKFYVDELQLVIPPEEWPIERIIRRRGNRYLVKFFNDDAHYWVDDKVLWRVHCLSFIMVHNMEKALISRVVGGIYRVAAFFLHYLEELYHCLRRLGNGSWVRLRGVPPGQQSI